MLTKIQHNILEILKKGNWFIPSDLREYIYLPRKNMIIELDELVKLKLLQSEIMTFRNKNIKRYSITTSE